MMKNDEKYFYMPNVEKQKIPLPNEVSPDDAFTKLSIYAALAASQYKLNTLNIHEKSVKK
ncbi:MAG: hypothetical protein L3J89_13060 [Gammaproteobacteria bacterium]|nr:hypothetical protein [Gammaproteobacteria bacterium]